MRRGRLQVSIENNGPAEVEWTIRLYREGDIPAIVALENHVFKADGVPVVASEREQLIEFERPGFDPAKRVLLVEGPGLDGMPAGMLLGYAALPAIDDTVKNERTYMPSISVHPAARELGLVRALAERLLVIARQEEAEVAREQPWGVVVKTGFPEQQRYLRTVWEDAGLTLARQFWTMACPLDELDEPALIEGVTVRNYSFPGDNAGAIEAFNQSFCDHYDFHPQTEERWNYRLKNPFTRLDLSWVAEVDGEPGKFAGFCMCSILTEENEALQKCEGWIDLLGTVRGWRGRGLGRSLLLQSLHSLRSAGMDTGVLGVDSTSPTGANRLYESVGFRVREIWLQFEASLADIRL